MGDIRRTVTTTSVVLLGVGVIGGAATLWWWSPCLQQVALLASATSSVPAGECESATHASPWLWLTAVLVWMFAVGAVLNAILASGRSILGLLAFLPLLAGAPVILDRGFFWQGWDTSGTTPGTGVIVYLGIVLAAFVLPVVTLSARNDLNAAPGRRGPAHAERRHP